MSADIKAAQISESRAAAAFNWPMKELSAPVYAQTSELQIRVLTVTGRQLRPNLFAKVQKKETAAGEIYGQSVNNLSPVGAVALMLLMLHQKVLNQSFQKEPARERLTFRPSN